MGEIAINPIHNIHKKYRTMNLVNPYIFAPPAPTYNTYIGGVSASISTVSLLATKLGISVGAISNFVVVGSDIKCTITGAYNTNGFYNDGAITYYHDLDNLITDYPDFRVCTNLKRVTMNGVTSFAYTKAKVQQKNTLFYLPAMTSVANSAFAEAQISTFDSYKIFYIPNATSLGSSSASNSVFAQTSVAALYCHPSLATNNGGAEDGDVAVARAQGAKIVFVSSFVAPSAISNLSSGNITDKEIQLNFTPPSSTNTIDFYEVYVNDVYYSDISVNGGYIGGLTASTSYSIKVKAIDIYFNKSLFSNTISASTNSTANALLNGLVSFYNLNETTTDDSIDSFGCSKLVNTGITVNQTGKIGASVLSTGSNQKLRGFKSKQITGKFTINAWTYRTATSNNFGTILEYGTYNANCGFGIWVDSSNKVGWRINQDYNHFYAAAIPLNTWVMVTIVYNQTDVKLYIDSVLKTTTAMTTNPSPSTMATMFYGHNGSMYFGRNDLVSVYEVEKSQADITSFYNSGTGITP